MTRIFALLPFGYLAVTRVRTPRDFVYLALTQLVPGGYIAVGLGESTATNAVFSFFIGYIGFLAIYEIGYLANDAWDAKASESGRLRIPFGFGPSYAIFFVLIRILSWVVISWWWSKLNDSVWLAMTACLICAFTLHNSVKENAFRLASFVQLTLLRFIMPIIFVVGSAHFAPLSCLCVLLYMHFRNLSYLESKGFLVMPERKIPSFSFIQILMFAPMVIVLSVVQNNIIYGEVWAYYCAVYAGWSIASTARVRTGW